MPTSKSAFTFWGSCLLLVIAIASHGQDTAPDTQEECLRLIDAAYRAEDYGEFQRLATRLTELAPRNYLYRYNLACACALNGAAESAVDVLRFLLEEDYDLVVLADTDTDFDSIRSTPAFQSIAPRISERKQPLGNSKIAFSIPEPDLIPEGIAHDPVDDVFYLSSIQKCKILRIERNGEVSDFVESRQDSLVPVLGMRVDAGRRHLWAAASYGSQLPTMPAEMLGTSGVFKYDLRTGKLLKKYMLPQGEHHFLNDLTISSSGEVYVTDWRVFAIYKISPDTDTIEKFIDMPRQPNGIDLAEDETKLFIAGAGIGVLDIATRSFRELECPPSLLAGGDGLYYYRNSLIAIQSGAIDRVGRLHLNHEQDAITRCQPLEAWHPQFKLPTTGVLVGDEFFYVANSQIRAFDADGNLPPLGELEEPMIFALSLR